MNRRRFLQISGVSAAVALLEGCRSGNEQLIPFLVPPDEGVTPGLATYYASSCRSCPAGCGILVRIADGRAKKIEGNPNHPVNRGKLCARGQAALQEVYHPDRIAQPLKRKGPRGSGEFTPVSWKEGLGLLLGSLTSLQRETGNEGLALLTPRLRGTLAELTSSFMGAFGSPHRVSFDLLAPDWLRSANRQNFGQPSLPYYDMDETRYLISFGADFVENHLSPVRYGNAFGTMRQGRDTVRGHFTYVGGRMSLTCASADRWMPARPGTEGMVALCMARQIVEQELYDAGSLAANGMKTEMLRRQLAPYDLQRVAQLSGLREEAISEVAREFARTRPALALAGETVAFQTNGSESVRAVQLLNLLVGGLNRTGGVFPDAGSPVGPENSLAELSALVAAMRGDRIKVALVTGDPVHAVPPATGFQEVLARVPYIVSFSTLIDDTALQADLILPDHAALESWGDVVPLAGTRTPVIGLMQPVVRPVCDTRQFPDVLLAMAHDLGGATATALPYTSYLEMVKAAIGKRVGSGGGGDFDPVWVDLLRKGGVFEPAKTGEKGKGRGNGRGAPYRWLAAAPLPKPEEPRFAGDETKFPLQLQVYPSTPFYDGRGAPLPWLQQLPDPMTTVVWDSWVELNPRTAATLGIGFGDLVEVTSPRGSLRLPAVIYPGIRPEMVAIPLGQGHKGMGRYARQRGVNPLELVAALFEGSTPLPAWNATRVRVSRVSAKGELVTAGNPEGSYRSELIEI